MATTKRNPKSAEPKALATPYQAKPAEQAVIDRQREKRRARGPIAHMGKSGKSSAIGIVDHSDEAVGGELYMASIGTADWDFARIITAHIAGLAVTSKELDNNDSASLASFTGHQAIVQGIAPSDEIESLLAVQMAAVHSASMMFASRLRTETRVAVTEGYERSLNRLARTFAAQVEALKRHRSGGVQKVVVQHVQVNEGGQAVVAGEVNGGGGRQKKEGQPHERDDMRIPERQAMLGHVEAHAVPLQSAGSEGLERVPVSRGAGRAALRAVE